VRESCPTSVSGSGFTRATKDDENGVTVLTDDRSAALFTRHARDDESKSWARRFRLPLSVALALAPAIVIGLLWLPVLRYYHVPGVRVPDAMVQQARDLPADSVLDELKDFRLLEAEWKDKAEIVDAASGMLRGELRMPGYPPAHITLPFAARDLEDCGPAWSLPLAGFVVPDTLIQAYEISGREEFLNAAQAFILQFQAYEQAAFLPQGELWNDHAIAARIPVLANFWRVYRHSPNYRPEVGERILQMVGRSEQLLAKPGHFTFATNHGVMQNLALWHATLAFPPLPRTEEYQRLALARMDDQMKFYVSREGMVLEHSAGYHLYGVKLLGMAFRYLELMHQTPPQDWIDKYDAAKQVYALLRRPDGSLPMFGDTDSNPDSLGPLITTFSPDHHAGRLAHELLWKPAKAVQVDPIAGYSIWWDGLEFWPNPAKLSQTVVTWSNFPDHGHKHADEMSLLLWAGGQNWWSNVGYWPYDVEGREAAQSWDGSNAPHLVGESFVSPRTTRLVSSGWSAKLDVLELDRTSGRNFYTAHRQVIHWKPDLWVVLDSTFGQTQSVTRSIWTTASDVRWEREHTDGSFVLASPSSNDRMNVFFFGSPGMTQKLLRGSDHPFAGWQVEGGTPVPSSSLVTQQPANNSWAATVWTWERVDGSSGFAESPQMARWTNAADWEMRVPRAEGSATLRRKGDTLELRDDRGIQETMRLTSPPDSSFRLAELHDQFASAGVRYRRFHPDSSKRLKVTWLLGGLFLLQLLFFAVYKRVRAPGIDALRWLTLVTWIVGGFWLVGIYF